MLISTSKTKVAGSKQIIALYKRARINDKSMNPRSEIAKVQNLRKKVMMRIMMTKRKKMKLRNISKLSKSLMSKNKRKL